MNILKALHAVICAKESIPEITRNGSRHYTSAIADGLRNGSSESAKVMAAWRWKNKTGKR
jgi:hypothetical protein